MIFDNTHQLLFIHIPKTGGYSVRRYYNLKVPKKVYKQGKYKFLVNNQHALPHEIKQFHSKKWDQYHKMCVVRNPWARFVSFYAFFKNRGERMLGKPDFEYFLYNYFEDPTKIFKDHLFSESINFLRPCSEWSEGVDHILKLENIEADIKRLNEVLGINVQKPFPKTNVSGHKDYREFYTDNTKDYISTKYKDDIVQFNYVFGEE